MKLTNAQDHIDYEYYRDKVRYEFDPIDTDDIYIDNEFGWELWRDSKNVDEFSKKLREYIKLSYY